MYVPLRKPPTSYYEGSLIKAAAKTIIDDWNCGRRIKDIDGNVVGEVNDLIVTLTFASNTSGESEPANSPKNFLVLSGHFGREENKDGELKIQKEGSSKLLEVKFDFWVTNLKAVFAKEAEQSRHFSQTGLELSIHAVEGKAAGKH